jgi:hypothetical protein
MTTLSRTVRPLEIGVRAKRVRGAGGLVAQSKTLGAPLSYKMETDNLSRTGVLLTPATKQRVPFRINTLIEMTLDPDGAVIGRPLYCLGKVVRLEEDDADLPRFGVQIVQMDSRDLDVWEECLTTFESHEQALLPAAG